MKNVLLLLMLTVILFISACGGGGGSTNPASIASTVTSKAITSFAITSPAASGTIDEAAKTVALTVPNGTDVNSLVATFETTGALVKVGSTVQTSGVTSNNFTNPVLYTATAADASTAQYTVTVTMASVNAKAITSFSILGAAGVINDLAKTIAVTLPYGTNVTALAATFATTGASVSVGSIIQVSGTTTNDFTTPVIYTVTGADSSTTQYTVTVTMASVSAKEITSYSILGVTGVINEPARTIAVTVPAGTNVTALVATFATTGASVSVGSAGQVSGTSANDFTSPVIYTVKAADNSTTQYTVTVTVPGGTTGGRNISLLNATASVDLPSIITFFFQASDVNGNIVTSLTNTDFIVLEDNATIDPNESFQEIVPSNQLTFALKTVLLIDVSSSISASDLINMKAAAKNMVANMVNHQQIAIYAFDDRFLKIADFTNNTSALNTAIDSITIGHPSTDLYGSVQQALGLWTDSYLPTGITQGFLIVVTDGQDTAGVSSLDSAVAMRGSKRIFTIGAGANFDTTALTTLGNAGYFPIGDYSQLQPTLGQVSAKMAGSTTGFYYLHYASPKRSGTHTLTLKVAANTNTLSNATITKDFSASSFSSVTPLASLAITPMSPNIGPGPQQFQATGTFFDNSMQDLTATTTWSSSDTNVATISIHGGLATGVASGTTIITATSSAATMFKFASTTLSFVDASAPSTPINFLATAASATQIDLSWTASTDNGTVAGYKIYRDGNFLKTASGTATSDSGLTASTNYCYTVSAYDASNNESATSAQSCAKPTPPSGVNFKIPDTNQTTSYTTTFGEDHDYTINPPSYTDNGNSTVTDNVTGLVWQKQDDGVEKTWAGAITYCDNLSLGGQAGWRLPSRIELISLIDNGGYNPSINATYFPNTIAYYYWSSTTSAYGGTSYAWIVDFGHGFSSSYDKPSTSYARCVRGGQ